MKGDCFLKKKALIFGTIFFFFPLLAEIRVVPVISTPVQDRAKIKIVYPENEEMKNSLPIRMVVIVSNYSLGEDSAFQRTQEIYNWDIGQSIRVVIDNRPFFAKITQQIAPFEEEGIYFQSIFEFYLPQDLAEGSHVLRAYLVRSYGESLKNPFSFDAVTFYYKDKKKLSEVDLNAPYLTYNEPAVNHSYDDNKPILLDFYVKNCKLSQNGYKVKLIIDKKDIYFLDKWSPYYIFGLRKGIHQLRLQLMDSNNKLVSGKFNDIKAQFNIK